MPSTLQQAVAAELPLIAVTTRDRANAPAVVHRLVGEAPEALPDSKGLPQIVDKGLYQIGAKTLEARGYSYNQLYALFAKAHASLVVFNLKEVPPEFFDAGELPTPPDLVVDVLTQGVGKEQAEALLPAFGGLTIKEVTEVFKLTKVRDGRVTPRGIAATRKELFRPAQGLQLVDTHVPVYWPQAELEEYASETNAWYFLHDEKNPRLWPRGILLKGMSGAGKTTFAKWLANSWGVPLFRMNVSFHNKYVGESARLFSALLDQLDQQAPCIVLWDEVEKMFSGDDSSTQQVLSLALWWLQEHRSRVLSVMTCNHVDKLPVELYRPGRVDQVVEIAGLTFEEAKEFAIALVDTFDFDPEMIDPYMLLGVRLQALYGSQTSLEAKTMREPHGAVAQAVIDVMKASLAGS